jgi:hypothetical protein
LTAAHQSPIERLPRLVAQDATALRAIKERGHLICFV